MQGYDSVMALDKAWHNERTHQVRDNRGHRGKAGVTETQWRSLQTNTMERFWLWTDFVCLQTALLLPVHLWNQFPLSRKARTCPIRGTLAPTWKFPISCLECRQKGGSLSLQGKEWAVKLVKFRNILHLSGQKKTKRTCSKVGGYHEIALPSLEAMWNARLQH